MTAARPVQQYLHVERIGEGPPLVMLHGWAMHGGIWSDFARQLADRFSVYLVDLPGHGRSAAVDEVSDLDGYAEKVNEALARCIDEPFYLIGWSLGGLVALYLLLEDPGRVRKLQLIATNPSFVQRDDWSCGVNAHVLETFAAQLGEHYEQTLQRFLALQLQGDPKARECLRGLRRRLFERGLPSARALQCGLDILLRADLRARLGEASRPLQLVLGERDTLVPAAVAEAVGGYSRGIEVHFVRGAGHAPFLSHPSPVLDHTQQFFQ